MSRRPAFELAMRLEAEGRAGITFDTPTVAAGLVFAETGKAPPPTVVGLRLQDGRVLSADLVIDAGGRRSPVPAWLAEGGVQIPSDVQDCGVTYFTRYFRRQPDCPMPVQAIIAVRAEFENLMVIGFTGDHDTYAITLASASWDDELRDLRHAWAWDAVVASLPTAAAWTAPDTGVPLHNVSTMAGHRNVRRHLVVDGEPLVLGLLPVGDSLCTTNPAYGWGASMALSYAFAACEAFAAGNGDLRRLALDYEAAVAAEADGVYQESAAMDRVRGYRWRGEPVPAEDEDEAERQSLIEEGIVQGMLRDAVLGRAFLRRANLLDPPRGILDDPEVLERATAMRAKFRGRPQSSSGPTRDELVATIATARPKAAET
jgi:hypothetical protein